MTRIRNDEDLENVVESLGIETLTTANDDEDDAWLVDQTAAVSCAKMISESGVLLVDAAAYTGMTLYHDVECGMVACRGVLHAAQDVADRATCWSVVNVGSLSTGEMNGLPKLDVQDLANQVLQAMGWRTAVVRINVVTPLGEIVTLEAHAEV